MAKADLTCDYYGDLELVSSATELEIKKQFRQLALKYHPDRNPGREHEVNAKFQTIQAAHEVLTDPEQRAKYDIGRSRGLGGSFPSQARPASGFARGNPWSNVASDFPPPPRATRSRPQPPPSAGAQRYANNFKPSAYGASSAGQRQADDDAAEARRKTYEAWSKMRGSERPKPPQPPGYPPPPGYDDRRSSRPPPPKPPPPPIPKRNGYAPGNAAGDEPPASNTSAYYTHRATRAPTAKQQPYQEPPPRRQPHIDPLNQFRDKTGTPLEPRLSTPYASRGGEKTNPFESINLNRSQSSREPSERTNPFQSNVNRSQRSQSTRVPTEKADNFTNPFGSSRSHDRHRSASPIQPSRQPPMASEFDAANRAGSETSFNTSPKRTYSKTTRPSNLSEQPRGKPPIIDLTSSEDESDHDEISGAFGTKPRVYARGKARRTRDNYTPTRSSGTSKASQGTENYGDQNTTGVPKTDPKMYGGPNLSNSRYQYLRALRHHYHMAADERKRSASVGQDPFATASSETYSKKWPNLFPPKLDLSPPNPPSGARFSGPSCTMNAFEAEQFNILDRLVKKHDESSPITTSKLPNTTTPVEPTGEDSLPGTQTTCPPAYNASTMREPTLGNTSRLPQLAVSDGLGILINALPGYLVRYGTAFEKPAMTFDTWDEFYICMKCDKLLDANFSGTFSFSFKVGDQTFTAHSTPKPFTSSSAENISTTFTPEDWHGKFGADENYFGNDSGPGLSRGSSGSRTRGQSREKPQPQVNTKQAYPTIDPETLKQSKSADTVASPTKFSAEEWAQTFKAPIFSGPPHPTPGPSGRAYSRSGVSRRPKAGSSSSKGPNVSKTTGTISSDEGSDELLFMGSRTVPSAEANANIATEPGLTGSPNAMDIDPPLATGDARNVNVEPSRPEWRAGGSHDTGFVPTEATTSAQNPPPPPPAPPAPDATELQRESRDSDFATNFEDLKKTEPLHTPATGLSSFADLTSNLPFASKASSTVPLGKGFNTTELALPLPPRGPSTPSIAPNAPRPSQEAWESYLASMKAYMAEWDAFNTKMVMHFVARKNQVDQFPSGWMGTIGGKDVAKYLEGVKEDEKVREWWDVACHKHCRAMEDFVWAREVFKSGLQAVGPRSAAAGATGEKLFGEVL